MELTAEAFRQIVETFRPGLSSNPPQEQRRGPRARVDAQAMLLPFSDRFAPDTLNVAIRDVSAGGFGFLHHRPLPLGTQFGLLLPESSGRPLVILCTITYWQPVAQDLFAVGASFVRVLRQGNAGLPLILEEPISTVEVQRAAS